MADTTTYTPPAGITLDPKLVSPTNPAGAPLINGVPQWLPPSVMKPQAPAPPSPPPQVTPPTGKTVNWSDYTNLTPGVAKEGQQVASPSQVIADMRAHGAPDSVIAQFSAAWGRGGVLTPETAQVANVAISNVNTVYAKGGQDAFNLAIQQGKIPTGAVYVPPEGNDLTKWSYLTKDQANQYIKDLVNKGAIVNVTKDINVNNPNLYTLLQNLDKSYASEYNAATQAAGKFITNGQINVTQALSSGKVTESQLQTLGVPKDTITQAQMALRTPIPTEPVIPAGLTTAISPAKIENLDSVITSIKGYGLDADTTSYLINLANQGNIVGLNAAIGNINQGITFRNKEQATNAINALPNLDSDTKALLSGMAERGDFTSLNAAIRNVSEGQIFRAQQLLIPARTDQTQNTNILGYTGSYDPTVIAKLNLTDKQLTNMGFSDKQIEDIKVAAPQIATVKTPPAATGTIAPSFVSAIQGAPRTGVIPTQVVSGRQTGNLGLPAPSFSPVTPKPSMSKVTDWILSAEPKTGGAGYGFTYGFNILSKGLTEASNYQVPVPSSLGRTAYLTMMNTPISGTSVGTVESWNVLGSGGNTPALARLPSLGQILGLPETNIALGTLGGLTPLTGTTVQMEQILRQVSVLPAESRAALFANNPELEAAYNARIAAQKTAAFEARVAEAQAQKVTVAREVEIASKIKTGETPYATGISSLTTERFLQRFGQPAPSFPKITPAGQASIGIVSTIAGGIPSSAPITTESIAALTPVSTIATKATPVVTGLRLPTEVGISGITVPTAIVSTTTQKILTPTVTTQTQIPQAVTVSQTVPTITQVTPTNPLTTPTVGVTPTLPKFTPITQTTQTISSVTPTIKTVTTTPLFTPTVIQTPTVVQPQVQIQQPSIIPVPTKVQVTPTTQVPSIDVVTPTDITAPTNIPAPTVIPATIANIIGTQEVTGKSGETSISPTPPPILPGFPLLGFPQLRNTAGTSGGGGYSIDRKKQYRKLFQYIPATVIHMPEFKGGINTKDILGETKKVLTTRKEITVSPSVRLKAGATEAPSTSTYRGRSITNRNFSPMG